jgi:DNA-directed RNA polymerase subunit E'/Rpb7
MYIYQKIDMPREIKVVDKTMRKDPTTGKMVKNENYMGVNWTEKKTYVKRGDVVRKKITGESFEAIRGGKPVSEKNVKIEKFDRSGKLRKTIDISDGKKVVSRPGKKVVEKSINVIDRIKLKKNI